MLAFLLELLLYSGQYGMFYLLMNFVHTGFISALTETSHGILLFTLILQCLLLSRYGSDPKWRLFLSLMLPMVYTGVEFFESPAGIWKMGHIFFWIFSVVTGFVHAFALWRNTPRARLVSESVISFANIGVFVFTYFYLDLLYGWEKEWIVGQALQDKLSIVNFFGAFRDFFQDPVHIYFLIGSLVLAGSIALARSRILHLQDRVTELLGMYVDSSVRDKILDMKKERILSQKKVATVLFSDIRSFTSMTERSSPEEIVRFLNGYFSLWDDAAKTHGWWIDKFIGDAVMVIFDKGTDQENVRAALACSEEIFRKLPSVRKGIFREGRIGIGIHSGEVIAGDIGSTTRRNYTVIGDTVNIASRLEGLCKELGMILIVSGTVYDASYTEFPLEFLGETSIRGKQDTMRIYGRRG